jgi:hypothetical protein
MEVYSGPEKTQGVFWFKETKLATVVHRRFSTKLGTEPHPRNGVCTSGTDHILSEVACVLKKGQVVEDQ